MSRIRAKRDKTSKVNRAQDGRHTMVRWLLMGSGFLFFMGINSSFVYGGKRSLDEEIGQGCGPVLETPYSLSLQVRLFEIRVALNCFYSSIQGLDEYEFLEATKVFVNHTQQLLEDSFADVTALTQVGLQTSQAVDLRMMNRSLRFLERVSTLIKTVRYQMSGVETESDQQSLIVLTKIIPAAVTTSVSEGFRAWVINELSSLNSESLVVFGVATHAPVRKTSKDKIFEFLNELQSLRFADLGSVGSSQKVLGLLQKNKTEAQRVIASSAGDFLEAQVHDFFEPFLILFETQMDLNLRRVLFDSLNQLVRRVQGFLTETDPYFSSLGLKNFFRQLLIESKQTRTQMVLSTWDDVEKLSRLVRESYQGQSVSVFEHRALIFPPVHMTDRRRVSIVFVGQPVVQEVPNGAVVFSGPPAVRISNPGDYDVVEEIHVSSKGLGIYLRSGATKELRSIRLEQLPGSMRFRLVPALEYLPEVRPDGIAPVGRGGRYVS